MTTTIEDCQQYMMYGHEITILGVDDKPENLFALEAILADLDVQFIQARSGDEALKLIAEREFALVLLDVMMPGLDGYKTAELIRKNSRNSQTPIIFITAVIEERQHICRGYGAGAVDYLFKPIIPEVLKKKVTIFAELYQQRKSLEEKARQLEKANERICLQQEDLACSEVRFRTAFEQSFQFMAILDAEGRVIELNRLAKKLCGNYRGSLAGQYLWNICWVGQEEENLRLQEAIVNAGKGEAVSDEAKFVDTSGQLLYLSRTVSPVTDDNGNVIYITVQGHDITPRVLAEREKHNLEILLQQSQKMEALGALAGGIAHDFNNVLSVIIGNANLAENSCESDSPMKQFLLRIREAGDKAKELVKQILAFSRRTEVEKVVLQPSKVILESVKLLRASIPTTIDISYDIDRQCGPIFADPIQYHQIIMNLCTNAFHAMETTGGRLFINLRQVELDAGQVEKLSVTPGKYAHLTVEDSGCGIEEHIVEKIFDPYFTTKEKGKGTGMGLAIVHGIVKGHGGGVLVESNSGKGTAFHVYMPLADKESEDQEQRFEELSYGSEHILLVDDEESLLEMMKNMLEMIGYRVTAFSNSSDALHYFCNHSQAIDMVISDQTMPKMTGAELARRLLRLRPKLPILLCTGFSPNVSRQSIREMGICDLITKPISLEELSSILRRIFDESR